MKPIVQLILILLLTFTVAPVYADDYQDGLDAYENHDEKTAIEKFLPLAGGGNAAAQYYLGTLMNYQKWMRMSAEQGYAPAQFHLGFHFKFNDCKEARQWMQAAIDQNYQNAFEEMGNWYWNGECVPKSFKEAVRLFQIGANMKYPPAQYALGRMYYEGEGVAQNYVIAYSWFILGAIDGHDRSVYWREKTRKQMSASQIEKAQEMARNWKPKKSKGFIDQLKEKVGIK